MFTTLTLPASQCLYSRGYEFTFASQGKSADPSPHRGANRRARNTGSIRLCKLMGSRGQLLGVGWQGSAGGCREAVAPEPSASSSRPRPRGAERRNRLGPAYLPAGDRRGDPPRSHTRTGCPARAGRTGPAAFPGHPRLAWPRPRTPRRLLRPRSGPAARQPQLRARLGSAGLGLLFGRDASSERRLTRGGRAGTGASAFSSRSAPVPPSRPRRKRRPQDSPHRRPPGSPG